MTFDSKIIQDVKSIRPLSQSAIFLATLVQDPNYKTTEVVRIVESDAALTASVLRVVNSAAFARRASIETVRQAVPILGEKALLGIAFALCTSYLYADPLEGYEAGEGALWKHGLLTGIAAREVSKYSKTPQNGDVAFTAGILHDLGKLVVSIYLKGHTAQTISAVESGQLPDYLCAEREILGTDHCEIGASIAKNWQLPEPFQEALAYHHAPSKAKEAFRPLVYIVHIADFVAMMAGSSTGSDAFLYELDKTYKDFVKISKRDLEKIMLNAEVELDKTVTAIYSGGNDTT